jgi:peptidyl-prolyl cis-trans isomerase C
MILYRIPKSEEGIMRYAPVKMLFALLAAAFLCSGIAHADEKEVLAKIGKKTITSADLEMIISFYPENQRALIRNSPEDRDAFIKDLVTITVVSDVAKKKGYEKNRAIRKQAQLMKDQLLAHVYLSKEIIEKVKVSDKEAENYYEKNKKVFEKPEQVRARHILIVVKQGTGDNGKKAAKKKAEEILDRVRKGEDFAKLAGEFSDDLGSKQKGGDLGFWNPAESAVSWRPPSATISSKWKKRRKRRYRPTKQSRKRSRPWRFKPQSRRG